MKENEKIMSIVILFWFSFLMWLGFANGVINGLYPIRGVTESFDLFKVVWQTMFYFCPHLFISLVLVYKYGKVKQQSVIVYQ